MHALTEFFQTCFSWPVLPATILVGLVLLYWVMVIFSGIGVDMIELDFDFPEGSILDLGFAPFRFLNLGTVPLMLWMSIFAFTAWISTIVIDGKTAHGTFEIGTDLQAIARTILIASVVTKLITQPFRGKFDVVEPNKAIDLIGKTCVVTTNEVTETFGEAKHETEGAPLILNVRTEEGTFRKGEAALIVSYSIEENIYFIKKRNEESAS